MSAISRLKIITAYDAKFQEIGKISEKSIRIYAGIHNMDYCVYRDIPADRPPAWAKIKFLIDEIHSGTHEFLLWVDADACFVRGDESILNHIRPDKEIYMVNHRVCAGRIPDWSGAFVYFERPNTGVMLVKASRWSLDLLQRVWEKSEYLNHPWWEQAAFHDVIGYHREISLGVTATELDPEIISRIHWLPGEWNSVPTPVNGEPVAVAQSPVIIHFAGMPNEGRLAEMNKLSFNTILLSATE